MAASVTAPASKLSTPPPAARAALLLPVCTWLLQQGPVAAVIPLRDISNSCPRRISCAPAQYLAGQTSPITPGGRVRPACSDAQGPDRGTRSAETSERVNRPE